MAKNVRKLERDAFNSVSLLKKTQCNLNTENDDEVPLYYIGTYYRTIVIF